ncbi:MAG: NDNF family protein [Lentimicrobiaceae bacterium]|nr:NDNF family protein [Lentimicrobiaceae bacterium]
MMNKLFVKIQIFIAALIIFCNCEKVQTDKIEITDVKISEWLPNDTGGYVHYFQISLYDEIKDTTFKCGVFISKTTNYPDKKNHNFCFYADNMPESEMGDIKKECFTKQIDINLYEPNTTYYWRAFVKKMIQGREEFSYYDKIDNFYISVLPDVTTHTVANITCDAATLEGEVKGGKVTEKGFCLSEDNPPTLKDKYLCEGGDYFTLNIENLLSSTLYYVRAYAIHNSQDTVYGDIKIFTTAAPFAVETIGVYDITNVSAKCSGEVTGDCGFPVFIRGFCWSVSPNPTINDAHSGDSCGAGTGEFDYTMAGLKPNTQYYVKAFAMNNQTRAVEYGETLTFTTKE